VDPAPDRQKRTPWKEFLHTHWDVLATADCFSVEVWTALGLVRYHVSFVLRLGTREVHIAGIVPEPHGLWMKQMARNLTDGLDEFLSGCRYLIHDRASVLSEDFRMILQVGIESVRLPAPFPEFECFRGTLCEKHQRVLFGPGGFYRGVQPLSGAQLTVSGAAGIRKLKNSSTFCGTLVFPSARLVGDAITDNASRSALRP